MAKYKMDAPAAKNRSGRWHYDCMLVSYDETNRRDRKNYWFISRKSFETGKECTEYAKDKWLRAIGVIT